MENNDMNVLAIIQARMSSSRLPRKMTLPIIDGKGALELMLERVAECANINSLAVATTIETDDDEIAALCAELGVECVRGSLDDVLDRFHTAMAIHPDADTIVRLTGDCPLHDPDVIDTIIAKFAETDADYLSNVAPPTFPDGLDTEVLTRKALEKTWSDAKKTSEREHVTLHIRNHPEKFKLANHENPENLSSLRWTLDEPADLKFIAAVYERLYPVNPRFGMRDVLMLLKEHPELSNINTGIARNEGLEKSLALESEKEKR